MNCLECRRRLLVDPADKGDELLRHLATCDQCAREAQRAWAFEKQLRSVLGVQEPAGLEPQTPLERSKVDQPVMRSAGRWALAAGLVVSLGLGTWIGPGLLEEGGPRTSVLAVSVIEHIEHEMNHLEVAHEVSSNNVALLLSQFGAGLLNEIEPVRYAGRCRMHRSDGVHLVVQGEKGPVTVLLMPGEYLESPERVGFSRFSGILIPTEYGSMAVVGERSERLDPVVKRIRRTLAWEI